MRARAKNLSHEREEKRGPGDLGSSGSSVDTRAHNQLPITSGSTSQHGHANIEINAKDIHSHQASLTNEHKITLSHFVGHMRPVGFQLRSLSHKANALLVRARTAILYYALSRLEKQEQARRGQRIDHLGRVIRVDVGTLYRFILRKSLPKDGEMAIERMKAVLGLIIVAEHPLPLDEIVGFLGYNDFDVRGFLRRARCILVPGTNRDITGSSIPQFRKTFSDFLTSDRAKEFQIELEDVHRSVASRCFELMNSQLRFNICGLCSSFVRTQGLDGLVASVPKGLVYASTSWSYHLTATQENRRSRLLFQQCLPSIQTFLYEKFLFWLEVVNLSGKQDQSARWMRKLANQLEGNELFADNNEAGLSTFARDASLLIGRFMECISASIPHIYISLLAFSPTGSVVANHYRKRHASTVIPYPPGMPPHWDSWVTDPRMGGDSGILSVSFSPCGHLLAAGYSDAEIRVWDVRTGKCKMGPLKGHRDRVNSVCFAPNSLLIASGSDDTTIRIWDAETGDCIVGPLTRHTAPVRSVSFSPDGSRIVSGSWDCIVRVWDVRTGDCVLSPLEGHSDWINCVSYSPDGSCIASGAFDSTIRLWNAQTGKHICRPLVGGHENPILSLSFHPDGRRLVSSSSDSTLRIWDIQERTCTHDSLMGHDNSVWSVGYSPDGRYIASGSFDWTIRIWDADTAVCVAGPFGGAIGDIQSIAFSPNGKYLAVGSLDGTIRLWDFEALLSAGLLDSICEDETSTKAGISDFTAADKYGGGWTLGPNGEHLFWTPSPFRSAIWRPSTAKILGRPVMIKPDLSNLVTGEEWLQCFPSS